MEHESFVNLELVLSGEPDGLVFASQLAMHAAGAISPRFTLRTWRGQIGTPWRRAGHQAGTEVELTSPLNALEIRGNGLTGRLVLSPTSEHWSSPDPLSLPCTKAEEAAWWLAEGLENMKRWNELTYFPHFFRLSWKGKGSIAEDDQALQAVVDAIETISGCVAVRGGASACSSLSIGDDLWFRVLSVPRAGSELREKLPGVAQLLIGSSRLISDLAGMLNRRGDVRYSAKGGLAFLRIGLPSADQWNRERDVEAFFVAVTESSKKRPPDRTLGEFEAGPGEILLTRRRRMELFGTVRRTPRVSWGLLVSEEHCMIAGVDPLEMLEVQLNAYQLETRARVVADILVREGTSGAIADRIWTAYRRAYLGEYPGGGPLLGSLQRTQEALAIGWDLWKRERSRAGK